MMSNIQWTDETWNPIAGCSKVSDGCTNCYALDMAWRLANIKATRDQYGPTVEKAKGKKRWTGKVTFNELSLLKPLRWAKPRKIFVNSMSDLFHEDVTDDQLDLIFGIMALAPWHQFQVLTKRPERMAKYLGKADWPQIFAKTYSLIKSICMENYINFSPIYKRIMDSIAGECILGNVWCGVSLENQETADERIPHLLEIDGVKKFLSCEPLLGPVDLTPPDFRYISDVTSYFWISQMDWIIVGGESGPDARDIEYDWVAAIRNKIQSYNEWNKHKPTPFFFKQWGGKHPKANGNVLDGRVWEQMP